MLKKLLIKKSIVKQIAFGYLVIMIAIISVFIAIISMLFRNKNESVWMLIGQSTKQTMNQLDIHIKTLLDLSKIPLFYEDILLKLEKSTWDENLVHQLNKDVYQVYNNIINLNDEVYSISIQNRSLTEFAYIDGRTSLNLNKDAAPWYYECVEAFGVPNIISTYPGEGRQGDREWMFGVSRGLVYYNQSRVAGVININTRLDYIDSLVMPALSYNTQRMLILDSERHVVYDSEKLWTGELCEDTAVLNMISEPNPYSKIFDGNLVIRQDSDISGWTLLNIIPISDINGEIRGYQGWLVCIMAIILLSVALIMMLLFRSIVKPISRLITNIEEVKKGNLEAVAEIDREDEFGILTRSFNEMVKQLDVLIHENYTKEVKRKELEMEMLQNQINPHFIYNTLEAINMVCQIEEIYDASDMIMKLSGILRYGLNKKTEVVTLEDEIQCVVQYLELQRIRFTNIEDYSIQVPPELMDAAILKLVLQPIVENAVYHGLGRLNQGGKITITADRKDGDLVIVVHDNGVGIEEEKVKLLNDYMNEKNDCFQSIGLRNVNIRIKLKYGATYGVHLVCDLTGTSAYIQIPL